MSIKYKPTLNQQEIMEIKLAIGVLKKYNVPASTGVENALKQEVQNRGGVLTVTSQGASKGGKP